MTKQSGKRFKPWLFGERYCEYGFDNCYSGTGDLITSFFHKSHKNKDADSFHPALKNLL